MRIIQVAHGYRKHTIGTLHSPVFPPLTPPPTGHIRVMQRLPCPSDRRRIHPPAWAAQLHWLRDLSLDRHYPRLATGTSESAIPLPEFTGDNPRLVGYGKSTGIANHPEEGAPYDHRKDHL